MIPVYLSRYNWQPGMKGSLFSWSKGETVIFVGKGGERHKVTIDSELRSHKDSPSGYVYECVFQDGSGRWALNPDQFEPSEASQGEIAAGRAELGLTS